MHNIIEFYINNLQYINIINSSVVLAVNLRKILNLIDNIIRYPFKLTHKFLSYIFNLNAKHAQHNNFTKITINNINKFKNIIIKFVNIFKV